MNDGHETSVGTWLLIGNLASVEIDGCWPPVVLFCIAQAATYLSMSSRNKRSAESVEVSRKKK
jgi:hypothetical protein